MFKKIFLGLLISGQSSGLLLSKSVEHGVFNPFQNVPTIHDKISPTSMTISNSLDTEHFQSYIDAKEKAFGKFAVMKISAFLPHFDQIGHKVLHANNEFVYKILSMQELPETIKKDLILTSIKMAQYGDDFGSYLLQMYYDIVDKSL
jgi:hypothetical protein